MFKKSNLTKSKAKRSTSRGDRSKEPTSPIGTIRKNPKKHKPKEPQPHPMAPKGKKPKIEEPQPHLIEPKGKNPKKHKSE